MNPIRLDIKEINSLDKYAQALVSSIISAQTLEAIQIKAYKEGLLEEDEEELSKTICWELKRLIGLYKTQLENISDRIPDFEAQQVVEEIKKTFNLKEKVKRKKKDGMV